MPDRSAVARPSHEAAPERLEQLFRDRAAEHPMQVAILFRSHAISYRDLDQWSDRIAGGLQASGVGRGSIVGLCMARSPRLIATMLAILKAGGAYLPLDPAYPAARLQIMLEYGQASLLIVDPETPPNLAVDSTVLSFDQISARGQDRPVNGTGDGSDLAYVIFTSGSTGRPKGVMLNHSAVRLVRWFRDDLPPADRARVAATTSICFDPSIIEIFATLGTGGTIILKENALEPFGEDEHPTLLAAPPSILMRLAAARAIPSSVRVINSGGDTLTKALVRRLYAACDVQHVYNHYGPTEATTCTTVARVDPSSASEPSIGTPIAGAEIHILTRDGHRAAPGEVGEIHIGGPNLAIGYIGDAETTASRFRDDPLRAGARLYRTGDLGRADAHGEIHFAGRRDNQVKIRGFRIELEEVETAISKVDGVTQVSVIAVEGVSGTSQLVAYFSRHRPIERSDIQLAIAKHLPGHMIPARFVALDQLPLSTTGKIDKQALKALHARSQDDHAAPAGHGQAASGDALGGLIAQVFSDHLGLAEVGPDDDLFALGGDSLLAVDVALDIERRTGLPVSAAHLGQRSTPRTLAAAITGLAVIPGETLIRLQPAGDLTPIYCVPELIGRPVSYESLARYFAPDRPVIGLSPGPRLHRDPTLPDLRALSLHYLEAIRSHRPHGPYVISGYSLAAAQAFDLACLCESLGEPVSLVLLDGPHFDQTVGPADIARWIGRQVRDKGWADAWRHLRHAFPLWSRLPAATRRPLPVSSVPSFVAAPDRAFARWLIEETIRYRAGPFGGPSLLIRSAVPPVLFDLLDRDRHLGWRDLLPSLDVMEISQSHLGMMQGPASDTVGRMIASWMSGTLLSPMEERAEPCCENPSGEALERVGG